MKRFLSDYGSIFVLMLLCAYYSVVTWGEQHPHTPAAGRALARTIVAEHGLDASVVILVRDTTPDRAFARAVEGGLLSDGVSDARTVSAATPAEARQALEAAAAELPRIDVIATHDAVSRWGPLQPDRIARFAAQHPALGGAQ